MAQARAAAGFTLIEVVIALAIVAITTMIAASTYRNHLRRGHRAQAVQALLVAAAEQEKFHLAHGSYGSRLDAAAGDDPPGLPVASRTPGGHYTLAVELATACGISRGRDGERQPGGPGLPEPVHRRKRPAARGERAGRRQRQPLLVRRLARRGFRSLRKGAAPGAGRIPRVPRARPPRPPRARPTRAASRRRS